MTRLRVAPTKSNQLGLRRQLAFAEEGYELLEQKRQLLVLELMRRVPEVKRLQQRVLERLARAHSALQDAELDLSSLELDALALAVPTDHQLRVEQRSLMGVLLPSVSFVPAAPAPLRGMLDSSASTDEAQVRFLALVPLLVELAAAQAAVLRIAAELRKTQRRCNVLSRIYVPNFKETLGYIAGYLEERERESIVILKWVRSRLRTTPP